MVEKNNCKKLCFSSSEITQFRLFRPLMRKFPDQGMKLFKPEATDVKNLISQLLYSSMKKMEHHL